MRLQYSAWLLLTGVIACGDDKVETNKVDAPTKPIDAPEVQQDGPDVDAPERVTYDWKDGGEVLLEYQRIYRAGMEPLVQARSTAFFWKSITPENYPFPLNPGCTKVDDKMTYPFGMGTPDGNGGFAHEYLDVGRIFVQGGPQEFEIPYGTVAMPPAVNKDGFARPIDSPLHHFAPNQNLGEQYLGNYNHLYNIVFTGSNEWPAQVHYDANYIPPAWTPTSPGFEPVVLTAGTPLEQTFTTPNPPTNKPDDGTPLSFIVAFLVAGVPTVVCMDDQPFVHGKITIPANMIDYVRSVGASGTMARALWSHRVKELTDGVTHNHKRFDFISTWCYVVPWTAAP